MNLTKAIEELSKIQISIKDGRFLVDVENISICNFAFVGGYDFHMHSKYEFHYIKSGKGTVILDGREFGLVPGSFYLTGPGIEHKQYADMNDPMLEYAMMCDIRILDGYEFDSGQDSLPIYKHIFQVLKNEAVDVVIDQNGMDLVFEEMLGEAVNKKVGYYIEIKRLVMKFLVAASRNFDTSSEHAFFIPKIELNEKRKAMIETYINDNIYRNISIDELAGHIFLSSRQLNRVVREHMGMSVHDYIMLRKIEKVKELLVSTEDKLKIISEKTGFSSEFHMSTVFSKFVGLSPSRYREVNLK